MNTTHTQTTASVSHTLRTELAARGVTAVHNVDRADTYLTIERTDGALITISGLTHAGDDVSITHTPEEHAGWLATLRADDYLVLHDTYDQQVPYLADTAALLFCVLNALTPTQA